MALHGNQWVNTIFQCSLVSFKCVFICTAALCSSTSVPSVADNPLMIIVVNSASRWRKEVQHVPHARVFSGLFVADKLILNRLHLTSGVYLLSERVHTACGMCSSEVMCVSMCEVYNNRRGGR